MISKKTFKIGGVVIPENKTSTNIPIKNAGIPETIFINTKLDNNTNYKILIKKGDLVKVGTLLIKNIEEENIHSSVCGTIENININKINDDYSETTITIRTKKDIFENDIDLSNDINPEITLSKEEIIEKIKKAGIVNINKFLNSAKLENIDTFIINGIECEPYLTADERLILEYAEEIVVGVKIINKILGIQNALIAIDENKKAAIDVMQRVCKRYVGVNIVICKNKYPQGYEHQLVATITEKELPIGKSACDVGCFIQNVGDVFAVYEAVQKNKPMIEKIVTITGDATNNPANFKARIGTPVSFLYNQCGILDKEIEEVFIGDPMKGETIIDKNQPIGKTTSGIILLSKKSISKCQENDCIRCGKCADVCPMGLEPFAFSNLLEKNDIPEIRNSKVVNCIECGACSYICPSKIPLTSFAKLLKEIK
ncbi:MAG: RnfABCDGE type electron transport complex subunit C [Alphaproteobacteria bacterium]